MDEYEKMTLKEHIQIARRAVKWCFLIEKKYTLCLFIHAFLTAVTPFVPIYFSAQVIDALAQAALREVALYAAWAVGGTFALKLLTAVVFSLRQTTEEASYRAERWAFAEKAMSMDYASLESREVSLLRERIRLETQTGFNRYYLYLAIDQLTANVTKIVSALSLSVSFFMLEAVPLGWKIALCVGAAATALAASELMGPVVSRFREMFTSCCVRANLLTNKYAGYVGNYASGMDIRLYAMDDLLAGSMVAEDRAFHGYYETYANRVEACEAAVTAVRHVMQFIAYGALLAGGVSVGSIARYVSCLMMLLEAIQTLASEVRRAAENNHYMKRYFSYFDIPNDMYQGTLTVEKRDDNDYSIEFCDVSFRYPGSETYALRHVNLKFKIGEKLAVVGMNGSGKTTFIKLLCRLYDPTEGEIRLNGVDIRKYDYDEYMSLFSVVFQDFKLFSFKLGQVVASSGNFDEVRVRECLEKANFGDRLRTLPEGVNTFLYKDYDKNGVEFSGGEAQKIALARALYKDAPFILLDEPTAALDPISEYEVYSNFNAISGDKTAVYISHRLASCRFCDQIAVFDGGRVVQVGSHEALLADEAGKYHALWTAQAQYYEN